MPITTEFWATTAQVIPALLLAFVVSRVPQKLKKKSPTPTWVALSTLTLISIALGTAAEVLALGGLLGEGGRGTARLVIIAIGVLSFWVVFTVCAWQALQFTPEDEPEDYGRVEEMSLRQVLNVAGRFLFPAFYVLGSICVALLPLAGAILLAIRI